MTASGWLELEEDRTQQEDQIRHEVQTIRDHLLASGFQVDGVFDERREGLIYSACYCFPGRRLRDALEVYLRVSMYMQTKGHSLGTQLDMALRKAEQEGRQVARVWLDAGVTGRDDKRPAFSRMMGRVTRDGGRGLIVYDLYRFYRNLQGLLNHYQKLDEAGVALLSLADSGVDFGSNTGKILLTMKGLLGEMMLDDLSRTTRDNKLSRARKGLSNASLPPFGYCTGRCFRCTDNNGPGYCPRAGQMPDLRDELDVEEGVLAPHPIESAAVTLTFDWYGTGEFSDRQVAILLNEHVHHLIDGTPMRFRPKGRHGHMEEERFFGKDSVRDMLQNPYYAGLVVYQRSSKGLSKADDAGPERVLFGGKHMPLVSMNALETAFEVRAALRNVPLGRKKQQTRVYPLTDVLVCERCGGSFRGQAAHGDRRLYEDSNRVQGKSECPLRTVPAEELEEPVLATMKTITIPAEWTATIVEHLQEGPRWEALRRERRMLLTRLQTLQEMRQEGAMTADDYRRYRRRYEQQLAQLTPEAQLDLPAIEAVLADFGQIWEAATAVQRKRLVNSVFAGIYVLDGAIARYDVREPFRALFPPGLIEAAA
ncbi:MAG TPA: recombinase family protein [Anaerolineae bacterium]|nr:recombinase family protein [Anaerolineae bacterium]